ncbi:MAG: alpha/beta fold hydrolase [Deltaproteobacteria bacterium]|nr:alpha/beta fold hydrolase [Deltaproteobacteria bacterium]
MRSSLLVTPFLAIFAIACSGSDDGGGATPTPDTGADADVPDPALAITCADPESSVYGDPGALPADKGAIIKCAKGDRIDKAALEAKARANAYVGKPFTSGAKIYRVLYRTERGGPGAKPGYSSAIVYLPDTPRAAKAPLILAAHGSRGQAAACAPSRLTPEGEYVRGDFESLVLPFVGAGFPVIAPDSAGYANYGAKDNPPSVYGGWDDVGKGLLDASHAMRKLAPSILSDEVVLAGHSQGGHTALAALALSATYSVSGKIKAVVTAAPLWLPQRTWASLFLLEDSYPFTTSPNPNMVNIWYHYTHGELLDGPGKGLDVFKADKRDGIKKLMDEACWAARYPALEALGAKASDIFDPVFVDSIMATASSGAACPTAEPKKAICEKWMARYLADRPKIEGAAKDVPILFLYGNKDTTIPPDRITCARDKLKLDGAKMEWCIEPDASHSDPNPGILELRADWAADWVASKTLGTPAPAPCALGEADITATCNPIPPNE